MTVRDEIVRNMADSFCVKRYGGGLSAVSPHLAVSLVEEFEFVYDTAVGPVYEELGQRLLSVAPPPPPTRPPASSCLHGTYDSIMSGDGTLLRYFCSRCGEPM